MIIENSKIRFNRFLEENIFRYKKIKEKQFDEMYQNLVVSLIELTEDSFGIKLQFDEAEEQILELSDEFLGEWAEFYRTEFNLTLRKKGFCFKDDILNVCCKVKNKDDYGVIREIVDDNNFLIDFGEKELKKLKMNDLIIQGNMK